MQSNPNSPFISVLGLGKLRSEHPTGKGKWGNVVVGILAMLAAPLFLLLAIWIGYDTYTQDGLGGAVEAIILPLILAAIAFVIGAIALWAAWRRWPLAAALYENGFALYNRKGLQQVPWDQIAAVWQNVTKHYYNGVYTGTTHVYAIQTKDNAKIVLNDQLTKVEDLGRAVQEGASIALFPNYVQALKSGQRLSFGPLSLDAAKLYSGSKKEVAWGEIKAIKINQGVIAIKKEKGWFNWASVTVPQVPNFFIFLEIVSRLTKVE